MVFGPMRAAAQEPALGVVPDGGFSRWVGEWSPCLPLAPQESSDSDGVGTNVGEPRRKRRREGKRK